MSQEEIIEILKQGGKMATKDISLKIGISEKGVIRSCKALLIHNEILMEIKQEGHARKVYWSIKNVKK